LLERPLGLTNPFLMILGELFWRFNLVILIIICTLVPSHSLLVLE